MEQIRSGELQPGDRLPPERELSAQLGVSRTAIREALRAMETVGYVESKVGGGTFVRALTMEDVAAPLCSTVGQDARMQTDLVEVRLLLETEAAARAADLRSAEAISRIEAANLMLEDAISRHADGSEADRRFHRAVAQAGGNIALVTILDLCGELMRENQKTTLSIPGQPGKTLTDHRRICAAIAAGDREGAAAAMRRHLQKAYLNLRSMAPSGQDE